MFGIEKTLVEVRQLVKTAMGVLDRFDCIATELELLIRNIRENGIYIRIAKDDNRQNSHRLDK
jgi:hypothetical protein